MYGRYTHISDGTYISDVIFTYHTYQTYLQTVYAHIKWCIHTSGRYINMYTYTVSTEASLISEGTFKSS